MDGRAIADSTPVHIIPITLEISSLREKTHWNVHETIITPEQYATQLSNSIDAPSNYTFISDIALAIRKQTTEYVQSSKGSTFESNIEDYHRHLKFHMQIDLPSKGSLGMDFPLFPSPDESPFICACRIVANHEISEDYIPVIAWQILTQICSARLSFDDLLLSKTSQGCSTAQDIVRVLGCSRLLPRPQYHFFDYTSGSSCFGHNARTFQIDRDLALKLSESISSSSFVPSGSSTNLAKLE
ncbi:MAG: hypothetical protein SGCHY_005175 [Lobulomycetales sp.]